jgi:hypothetical protein
MLSFEFGTELFAAMPALLQKTFKIVPAPLVIEAVPKAPQCWKRLILRSNANAEIVVPS